MSSDPAPLAVRAANYFSILRTASKDLNDISDQLGKSIAEIDLALKKLNLGVSVWVSFHREEGEGGPNDTWYRIEDIGYAKVGANWGVSIRKVEGDYQWPDQETEERWLFNDSPRKLRISAIDKIPELLETLSNEATKTTKAIRAKLADVEAVANVVKGSPIAPRPISSKTPMQARPQTVSSEERTGENIDSIRGAVVSKLASDGHASASQLLAAAQWTVNDNGVQITVGGMGKKMLALTVNAAAEKIIRDELQRLSVSGRFIVVPGDPSAPMGNAAATAKEAK